MVNEKRLIDAHQFRGKHEVAEVNGKLCSVICYADIVNAPTVDAVEVVHGRWFDWREKFPKTVLLSIERLGVFCSVCEMHADYKTDYCPNCGAKMDGDGNA